MIPRLNRLPSTHLASSVTCNTPYFTMKATRNGLSYHRFAFVVSKKIDKRAVGRNRMKRVLREHAYSLTLPYPEGMDILFIVRKFFLTIPGATIQADVKKNIEYIARLL